MVVLESVGGITPRCDYLGWIIQNEYLYLILLLCFVALSICSLNVPCTRKYQELTSIAMDFCTLKGRRLTQLNCRNWAFDNLPPRHSFLSSSTKNYFLSHFHSDHYGGINSSWNSGIIYCSLPTATLVAQQLGVDKKYIHPIAMLTPTVIESRGKPITVTLIDANHCPVRRKDLHCPICFSFLLIVLLY